MFSGIVAIKEKQKTIDDLLASGDIKTAGTDCSGKWELDILYQEEDCSIGFVECKCLNAGNFPDHVHKMAKEFLVVVKGKILLKINNDDYKGMKEGESALIPAGAVHHSVPLLPGTKIAYICVPCDKNIGSALKHNDGE